MKKAIAMRCTKEQFESIKLKLDDEGIKTRSIDFSYPYLTNRYLEKVNLVSTSNKTEGREIHETWDEKVFLEACGVEELDPKKTRFLMRQKTGMEHITINGIKYVPKVKGNFTITKEQIKRLEKETTCAFTRCDLKQMFPKVFEEDKKGLVVGVWYNNKQNAKFCITGFNESKKPIGYGFTWAGVFVGLDYNGKEGWSTEGVREMLTTEVEEALIKEAVKRGFVGNKYVYLNNIGFLNDDLITGGELQWDGNYLNFGTKEIAIFYKGKWTSVVPTITTKQAEEKLRVKILN